MRRIGAEALAARLARRPRGFALLDIREAGEAEEGHVPDATFLPRRVIEFRIDELVSARTTPIVVYDGGDGRAECAAATLARLGYAGVSVLGGGIGAWVAAGFRLATGVNVPSKRFGEHVLEEDHVASISPDALDDLGRSGVPFAQWDVRTPAEHARATLPGSLSLPGVDIIRHAEAAARDDALVVVHCAGRTRSIIAARTLTLLGVARAVALENGTMGWRLAGRSLEAGRERVRGGQGRGERAVALARESGVASVAASELRAALAARGERNVVVVDIRGTEEYGSSRIPGSVSRPGGQLLQATDEVLAVEAARVILVDDGDGRAAITGYWLRRMGYPDVAWLEGGVEAWREAGWRLVSGSADARPGLVESVRADLPSVRAESLAGVDPLILDVGTSRAFKTGHVAGAAWLPRGWLEAKAAEILPAGATIVVTEADEDQAILAAATLRDLGYDAAWLEGGHAGWTRAGLPLERAVSLPLDLPPDVVDPPYARGEAGMRRYLEWEIALTGEPPIR